MSTLFLTEIVPSEPTADAVAELLESVGSRLAEGSAQLVEAQVAGDFARVFVIALAESADVVANQLGSVAPEVSEPAPVRLVGASLDDVLASRPEAGYLVEWDIPSHIDMDTYLARKKEKSPLYANVPEVSFLRTYVREDMAKCLCFYDAPDTDAVVKAREVVSTPIDRLHVLKAVSRL